MTTTATGPLSGPGITKYAPDPNRGSAAPVKDTLPSANNGSSLKETDFLHLLTTQLVHQDPLNPESDTDFAAQMAQYSSLAEMRRLNDTMSKQATFTKVSQAASLIGKSVTTNDNDGGKPISGVVSAVDVAPDGTITLKVGTVSVPIEHVVSLASPDAAPASTAVSLPVAVPNGAPAGSNEKQPANGPVTSSPGLAAQAPTTGSATGSPADVSSSLQSAIQKAAEQTIKQLTQGTPPSAATPATPAASSPATPIVPVPAATPASPAPAQ